MTPLQRDGLAPDRPCARPARAAPVHVPLAGRAIPKPNPARSPRSTHRRWTHHHTDHSTHHHTANHTSHHTANSTHHHTDSHTGHHTANSSGHHTDHSTHHHTD